jgi:3-hydroxy-9,10-secoandrosta-1,3,5(10)-triene-9,17-dione monooxygenase
MLDASVGYLKTKINAMGNASAQDRDNHVIIAETKALLEELKAMLHHNFSSMMSYARQGQHPPLEQRLLYIYQNSAVPDRCVARARLLFEACGGNGMHEDKLPVGRIYRNLIAARQHMSAQHRPYAATLGGHMLGLETPKGVY